MPATDDVCSENSMFYETENTYYFITSFVYDHFCIAHCFKTVINGINYVRRNAIVLMSLFHEISFGCKSSHD